MLIVEEQKKRIEFDELKPGDVFNYDGGWYMKTNTVRSEMSNLNAVNLETGKLEHITPSFEVDYQSEAELRVKEV